MARRKIPVGKNKEDYDAVDYMETNPFGDSGEIDSGAAPLHEIHERRDCLRPSRGGKKGHTKRYALQYFFSNPNPIMPEDFK